MSSNHNWMVLNDVEKGGVGTTPTAQASAESWRTSACGQRRGQG